MDLVLSIGDHQGVFMGEVPTERPEGHFAGGRSHREMPKGAGVLGGRLQFWSSHLHLTEPTGDSLGNDSDGLLLVGAVQQGCRNREWCIARKLSAQFDVGLSVASGGSVREEHELGREVLSVLCNLSDEWGRHQQCSVPPDPAEDPAAVRDPSNRERRSTPLVLESNSRNAKPLHEYRDRAISLPGSRMGAGGDPARRSGNEGVLLVRVQWLEGEPARVIGGRVPGARALERLHREGLPSDCQSLGRNGDDMHIGDRQAVDVHDLPADPAQRRESDDVPVLAWEMCAPGERDMLGMAHLEVNDPFTGELYVSVPQVVRERNLMAIEQNMASRTPWP